MKLLIALVVALASLSAAAQSKIVSIDAMDLSYSGALVFKHDEGKDDDRDTTTFKINLNYAQNLEQYVGLMWKGQAYWNRVDTDFGSSDTLESSFGAAAGLLYNFQHEDIKNSLFAGVNVGIERATYEFPGGDDEAGFNLFTSLEVGKRWDLGSYSVANIAYAPTAALLLKRYGGDIRDEYFENSREIRFNFLKFDILF
jgi:hypothetical protein